MDKLSAIPCNLNQDSSGQLAWNYVVLVFLRRVNLILQNGSAESDEWETLLAKEKVGPHPKWRGT